MRSGRAAGGGEGAVGASGRPERARGVGRRAFLGGSLLLSFSLAAPPAAGQAPAGPARPKLPGDLDRHRQLDAWLRIGADGRVTLKTGKVELGQGVLTALGQICADELDVALSQIDVVSGDTRLCPNQGVTAGSMSMPQGGTAVRQVAAEARALLLELTNQLEGGLIQSLSWALKETVEHDTRRIRSRDWASYPILRFSEVPPVEVVLLDRPNEPPLGAGEASQGPAAAALANAVFDATGERRRDLPLWPRPKAPRPQSPDPA